MFNDSFALLALGVSFFAIDVPAPFLPVLMMAKRPAPTFLASAFYLSVRASCWYASACLFVVVTTCLAHSLYLSMFANTVTPAFPTIVSALGMRAYMFALARYAVAPVLAMRAGAFGQRARHFG